MKTILVPTDFSACAEDAANYAMNLAKVFHCKVGLLNAFHVPSAGAASIIGDLNKALEAERDLKLNRLKEQLNRDFEGVEINLISSFGFGVNEILDELKVKNYDLIVMGTKGASGIKEVFIGSVTANLVGRTEVPILAIPQGASYKTPETFTITSDLKKLNNPANLKFVASLANQFKAKVKVMKVKFEELDDSLNEIFEIEESMDGLHYQLQLIEADDIESVLLENTQSAKNILTIIHRNRNFFERIFHKSLSKKLAMHAKTPLLILQDK